ncbi:hypothetical protein [Pseudoalteromonas denitrificans]|uniref:Uncharacterized protein n=1 Tax=Pseudoalteromonas denitrificans DSM 6059 TaxID=1123010 RepID=A0A1I1RRQ8_9GAMM|nr:hypothetical protein [Pseudoalteromonas denitrificans]SFD34908.1 hypothetical protein SAMN02745724_04275 [Pseudoalteromonas denitrificans DSM 6059]
MEQNPLTHGPSGAKTKSTTQSTTPNIQLLTGRIPNAFNPNDYQSEVDQSIYGQKFVQTALFQQIPEVFENLMSHSIINLRSELTQQIAECVTTSVNADLG